MKYYTEYSPALMTGIDSLSLNILQTFYDLTLCLQIHRFNAVKSYRAISHIDSNDYENVSVLGTFRVPVIPDS